jgi:predicted regulator of Ras-like GTPase activity (Roadblock/LC7/MglB family)
VSLDPRPDLRGPLDRLLEAEGARAGYVVSDAGMVSTWAGNARGVDAESFVSLVSAQAAAATALAPLVCGREFSEMTQEGGRTTVRVTGLGDGWILASLHDTQSGPGARPHPRGDKVAALQADLGRLVGTAMKTRDSARRGGVADGWSDEAASRIDQVFRGGV